MIGFMGMRYSYILFYFVFISCSVTLPIQRVDKKIVSERKSMGWGDSIKSVKITSQKYPNHQQRSYIFDQKGRIIVRESFEDNFLRYRCKVYNGDTLKAEYYNCTLETFEYNNNGMLVLSKQWGTGYLDIDVLKNDSILNKLCTKDNLKEITSYKYDKLGNLTNEIFKSRKVNPNRPFHYTFPITEKCNYKYNNLGLLVYEKTHTRESVGDILKGVLIGIIWLFEYSPADFSGTEWYSNTTTEKYEYNPTGDLIHKMYWFRKGEISHVYNHFNEQNKLSKQIQYTEKKGVDIKQVSIKDYVYNNNGQLIEEWSFYIEKADGQNMAGESVLDNKFVLISRFSSCKTYTYNMKGETDSKLHYNIKFSNIPKDLPSDIKGFNCSYFERTTLNDTDIYIYEYF